MQRLRGAHCVIDRGRWRRVLEVFKPQLLLWLIKYMGNFTLSVELHVKDLLVLTTKWL